MFTIEQVKRNKVIHKLLVQKQIFNIALDELVVGYFMEWPTANQYAQHNKLYDEALGIQKLRIDFHWKMVVKLSPILKTEKPEAR